MLAKRIIPCLDVAGGRVVKGVRFQDMRDSGDPTELARYYEQAGADELVLLDITASSDGRKTASSYLQRVAAELSIPFTVGGGVHDLEDFRRLLRQGADKVSINTAAVCEPKLISLAASQFGSQCVVVAIDAKRTASGWQVHTHGGRRPTNLDAVAWAKQAAEAGAGEILLTSIDADGQQQGYDLVLTRAVSTAVNVPVIASGGAGCVQDFLDVFTTGAADAALAASLFHDHVLAIDQLKAALTAQGVSVRPCNSGTTSKA